MVHTTHCLQAGLTTERTVSIAFTQRSTVRFIAPYGLLLYTKYQQWSVDWYRQETA